MQKDRRDSDTLIVYQSQSNRISGVRRRLGMTLKDFDAIPDMSRMLAYRYARLQGEVVRQNLAGVLLCNAVNVRYATGARFAQVFNMHSPIRAVFVPAEGKATMFDAGAYPSGHRPDFIGEVCDIDISPYCLSGAAAPGLSQDWANEVIRLVRDSTNDSDALAIDFSEPEFVVHLVEAGIDLVNAEQLVDKASAVKSEEEIHCMSHAASIAESGLARIRENLRPGISEQALWGELAFENAKAGGEWFDYCALASGGRTNPWGREASDKIIRAGELVGVDTGMVGPLGYYADISRTFLCPPGRPTPEQRELYQVALENLSFNVQAISAGTTFREYAEKSWPVPEKYVARRYPVVAHGIGMGNEWPCIPYPDQHDLCANLDGVLEENMVIAVEACIGRADGVECVKLEDTVVVKEGGAELLSTFPFEETLTY